MIFPRRARRSVEAARHLEAVEPTAAADLDVPEALRAEVHRPAQLHARGVDVEPLEAALGEPGVVVVALVLHAAVERHHREVVRVRDGVDVAREAERERGERNDLREAAAGRAALDVERGSAGGLAHASDHLLAEAAKTLHEAERGGGLALAERGGRDGRHVDVLRALPAAEALQHLRGVHLREHAPVGIPLVLLEAQLGHQLRRRTQRRLRRLRDFPVLHLRRVKFRHVHLSFLFGFSTATANGLLSRRRSSPDSVAYSGGVVSRLWHLSWAPNVRGASIARWPSCG